MNKKLLLASLLSAVIATPLGTALAADQTQDRLQTQDKLQTQDRQQTREQDRIYGSQLMTRQERSVYRNKMRKAKTEQEREQIRNEHHEQMQVRAKARGVTLPDSPPAMGGGMGPGGGMGGGMGPGGGMGGGGKGR